jgi:hypothetical protein
MAGKPQLGIGSSDLRYDGKPKNIIDKFGDFLTPKAKAAPTPAPVQSPGNAGAPMATIDAIKKRNAALNSIK